MDNSTQEKLMRYLDKEMAPGEMQQFEYELATDPVMQNELNSLQDARTLVVLNGLKETVRRIHIEERRKGQQGVRVVRMPTYKNLLRYGMAAAASLVLILVAVNQFGKNGASSEELFSQQYVHYELVDARGGTGSVSTVEQKYALKDHTGIANLYSDTLASKDILLSGVSFLENGDPAKARNAFELIISRNKRGAVGSFNDEAEYYLALSLLKLHDTDGAATLMEKIHNDNDHLYRDKFDASFIKEVRRSK